MTRLLAIAAVGAALVVAGCGGDDDDSASDDGTAVAEQTTSVEEPAAEQDKQGNRGQGSGGGEKASGTTISTADSQLGEALFDSDDQAIYYFDEEKTSEPECYGDCAAAWPPVLTNGKPQASGGAREGLLGTTERDDGSTQVTYDGRPLYYYRDEGPGELRCHNVDHAGGLWFAVQPNGDPFPPS